MHWIIYIIDNFDQGQRRIARISDSTALLSSELSDVDAEELSDTENESDKSSKISDLEFQTFSSQKIVKRKVMEIEEGIYCL